MTHETSNVRYTFADFFSGAGGFSEGFLLADPRRYQLVLASDIRETAKLTHTNRFGTQIGCEYDFLVKDIRDEAFRRDVSESLIRRLGTRSLDVVCGGPPCQGFSVFGKREQDDPRNDLFRHYLKVIEILEPKYFVMENVPGLTMMYGGRAVDEIREAVKGMRARKYELVGPIEVNAANYGVPQLRERILFIGCRDDMPLVTSIPSIVDGSKFITTGDAIGDLAFLRAWETTNQYDPKYPAKTDYQRESRNGRLYSALGRKREDQILSNHEAARHTSEVLARFAMIEKGKGLESIPKDLWRNHLRSDKKWCVRLDDKKPSYTMVTLPDDFVHYSQHRVLTVREMARIQSFDDTFVFLGPRSTGGGGAGNRKRNSELPQYTQVGNAVPPLMAKAIASRILAALDAQSLSKPRHRKSGQSRCCQASPV